jgi:anti-anti-sigma regulatory factor
MSQPFELPQEMTIYSAMETRDALLAWITEQGTDSSQPLLISGAKVSDIDGSGLQLLASLVHLDQPWHLLAPSPALLEAGQTLGLSDWLNQQIAIV